jgi:hypothetical protein
LQFVAKPVIELSESRKWGNDVRRHSVERGLMLGCYYAPGVEF